MAEFDHVVARLISSPPSHYAKITLDISTLQQWFSERPWVSHFVPHLDTVKDKLRDFMDSVPVCVDSQPAKQSFRLGFVALRSVTKEPPKQLRAHPVSRH